MHFCVPLSGVLLRQPLSQGISPPVWVYLLLLNYSFYVSSLNKKLIKIKPNVKILIQNRQINIGLNNISITSSIKFITYLLAMVLKFGSSNHCPILRQQLCELQLQVEKPQLSCGSNTHRILAV